MELPVHVRRHLEEVKKSKNVLLVTHHDADGASSAGVIARALSKLGKDFDVVVLRQFYPETVESLDLTSYDYVVLTDLAGRYIDVLEKETERFFVIDHHDRNDLNSSHLFHPLQMGYNPDTDASASTLSSLFAYSLSKDEKTLAYGLVGAAGDNQIVSGRFEGLNRVLVARSLRSKILTVYRDLALPGIESRDLPWVLLYSDPPLPGLFGDEEAVYSFLERVGLLEKSQYGKIKYGDLSLDEKRKFFTALALHLLRHGWSREEVSSLVGEVYEINDNVGLTSRVRSMKALINSLAKLRRSDLFVPLFQDDFSVLYDAERLYETYRRSIARAIKTARSLVERAGPFFFVDGRGRIPYYSAGTVASVLSSELKGPVVVVVDDEGEYVKGSIRGGKDLSSLVERITSLLGGEGGGHSEAAGFRIREEDLDHLRELLENSKELEPNVAGPLLN